MKQCKVNIILSLWLFNVTVNTHAAEVILPDTGTVIQQLPKTLPQKNLEQEQTLFNDDTKEVEQYSQDVTPIYIQDIDIQGNTVLPLEMLEQVVQPLKGRQNTLADIQRTVDQISKLYHEKGYFLAKAYLPAQKLIDNRLLIQVLEGKLGQVVINNQSRVREQLINKYLEHIPQDRALNNDDANRTLLLLSDVSGISNVNARLEVGQQQGYTDIFVDVYPEPLWSGRLGIDNQGSSYTGQYRFNGWLESHSLLGYGESLTAYALVSDADLLSGQFAIKFPTASGLIFGAHIGKTSYELGEQFEVLDASGTSNYYSMSLMYPLLKTQTQSFTIGMTLDDRQLMDKIAATTTQVDKGLRAARLNLSYMQHDDFGIGQTRGGNSQINFVGSFGNLDIKTPSALNIDQASAKTNGSFQSYQLNLTRQQMLAPRVMLTAKLYGQLASKNLDSSEAFTFSPMRAYPSAEGLGDEGWGHSLTLNYHYSPLLNMYLFNDFGKSTVNKNRYSDETNSYRLDSAGFGVAGMYRKFDYNVSAALGNRTATTDTNRSPRVLAQMGWSF